MLTCEGSIVAAVTDTTVANSVGPTAEDEARSGRGAAAVSAGTSDTLAGCGVEAGCVPSLTVSVPPALPDAAKLAVVPGPKAISVRSMTSAPVNPTTWPAKAVDWASLSVPAPTNVTLSLLEPKPPLSCTYPPVG